MPYLFIFLISLIVVFSTTPFLLKLAKKFNFLDYPSALKIHTKPTPLLGGLAVFIGFLVALLLGFYILDLPFNRDMVGILIAGALVVAFGLVDDKKGLSPSYKFLGQIIASILFLILSHNTKILTGSNWDVVILLLWLVGLMNAVNFLDAMEGLCAGISFISASAFFVIALFSHQAISALLALALMGGLLGFLRYNWSPARIFLGDAGSMFNGFILGCLGILFARENISYSSLLVPILILSYPIFDISFVTLIRLREGRKVYVGDYNNSPRRIASLGMQTKKVVLWIYFFCFLLGNLGVLVYFFFDSPAKMLIAVFIWLFLTIFGVHLQRNFVNIREKLLLILIDVVMINVVFLFFFWVKFHSGLFTNQWVIPLSEYAAPAIWITLFWLNLFAIFGLYEVPGDCRLKDEIKAIAKALGAGIIIFVILTLNPSYLQIKSWILLLVYSIPLMVTLGLGRGLVEYLTRTLYLWGTFARRSIIIGTKEKAKNLCQKLSLNPEYGYRVLGLVKEEENNTGLHSTDSLTKTIVPILGTIKDLDEIARENKVQDILIAVEPDWKGSLQEIMDSVPNLEVSFKIIPDSEILRRSYQTMPLRSGLLLRIFPSHMRSWEWMVKRLFDALVSLMILIGLLPVWIVIALLVRLAFKAPPLIKEEYLGKMGGRLKLYKFRISHPETGVENIDQFPKIPISRLGKFLRNSSLEKTPIFINILKGEMSLVGPEPLPPETFEKLSNNFPLLPKRLNVKPGLFSLANVKRKFRDYVETAKDQLQDDLFYMENMSLFLDLKILVGGVTYFLRKEFI
jgi:UDP-GlcNAc:undecaprenyl-phosphate GlcNAc-1-phosphate transferase